jgi:2-methylcitrate dehydratase PrpD
MEHTLDPHGTMTKRLQGGGWQAYAGVTAALLARKGFTAPASILEGANGFCRAFCTEKDPDIGALTHDLGTNFEMRQWETKAYATRGAYGTAIEAVSRLREQHGVQADQVRRLVAGCSSRIHGNANTGRPRSVMAAQYNLPFVLATAFFYDLRDPSTWTERILADQRVAELLERTEAVVDEDVERYYRETRVAGGAKVTVELEDGRTVRETVLHTKGTPENPMTAADVAGKYRLLSGYALSTQQADDLGVYLDHLEDQAAPLDLGRFTGAAMAD